MVAEFFLKKFHLPKYAPKSLYFTVIRRFGPFYAKMAHSLLEILLTKIPKEKLLLANLNVLRRDGGRYLIMKNQSLQKLPPLSMMGLYLAVLTCAFLFLHCSDDEKDNPGPADPIVGNWQNSCSGGPPGVVTRYEFGRSTLAASLSIWPSDDMCSGTAEFGFTFTYSVVLGATDKKLTRNYPSASSKSSRAITAQRINFTQNSISATANTSAGVSFLSDTSKGNLRYATGSLVFPAGTTPPATAKGLAGGNITLAGGPIPFPVNNITSYVLFHYEDKEKNETCYNYAGHNQVFQDKGRRDPKHPDAETEIAEGDLCLKRQK